MLLLTFGLPSNSIAAELAGPKVSQRNSTSFEDATNSSITIDIHYTVEDESGVDENKIPEIEFDGHCVEVIYFWIQFDKPILILQPTQRNCQGVANEQTAQQQISGLP